MLKRMRPLLGTFVEIQLVDTGALAENQYQDVLSGAFSAIEQIHNLLSFHQHSSDLSRLNSAQNQWVPLHPLSIQCLKLARALTRISKGTFNCTLGKAIVDKGALPAPDYINTRSDWLSIGNWDDIEIQAQQARLRRPVLITLDGIAKGFAIDIAIRYLQHQGVASAWINAGGDIRVYGSAIMSISIKDHCGQLHSMGGLQNAALATSTTHASAQYPGLVLGNNAEPVAAGTWSVIANSAWRADALTKVAVNLAEHERGDCLRKLGGNWITLATDTPSSATFPRQQLSE